MTEKPFAVVWLFGHKGVLDCQAIIPLTLNFHVKYRQKERKERFIVIIIIADYLYNIYVSLNLIFYNSISATAVTQQHFLFIQSDILICFYQNT